MCYTVVNIKKLEDAMDNSVHNYRNKRSREELYRVLVQNNC